MPLHPQVKTVLDLMTAAGPPLHHLTPVEARQAILAMRTTTGEPERVAKVEDRTYRAAAGQLPACGKLPQRSCEVTLQCGGTRWQD